MGIALDDELDALDELDTLAELDETDELERLEELELLNAAMDDSVVLPPSSVPVHPINRKQADKMMAKDAFEVFIFMLIGFTFV